ncbi:MAG TPA: ATP-binding cassette domain-containing protein [Acidimicrobiales bacterium]
MSRPVTGGAGGAGGRTAGTPLLRLEGISKRFGAVQALQDVDFECDVGEVVALVGDNGAGKSTLVKAIAGTQPADSGRIFVDGREVHITSPQAAAELGIATVYQDLALCDNLDVVANLYVGRERARGRALRGLAVLDEVAMEHEAQSLLERLSVRIPSVRTEVASLSGGQRQSIAVARATMGDPRVVILDEPTAALGVAQTAQVLDLVRRLRDEGHAVIVISHNMVDVFAVADRIVVLRLGRRVATFRVAETTAEEVVAAITGAGQEEVRSTFASEAS